MFSGLPSPVFVFGFEPALLNRRTRHYRTSATPKSGTAISTNTMCTLKKQCYACKGGCVEQVVVHCPSYLAGYDCGHSDVSRAGQAGGMLLQEILHLSPCPKHGIDNPHDQCKVTHESPMYQISINTECLLGSLASLSRPGPRVKIPDPRGVHFQWAWKGSVEQALVVSGQSRSYGHGTGRRTGGACIVWRDKKISHRRQ